MTDVYCGDDRVTKPAGSSTVAGDRHSNHRFDTLKSVSAATKDCRRKQDGSDRGGLLRVEAVRDFAGRDKPVTDRPADPVPVKLTRLAGPPRSDP